MTRSHVRYRKESAMFRKRFASPPSHSQSLFAANQFPCIGKTRTRQRTAPPLPLEGLMLARPGYLAIGYNSDSSPKHCCLTVYPDQSRCSQRKLSGTRTFRIRPIVEGLLQSSFWFGLFPPSTSV